MNYHDEIEQLAVVINGIELDFYAHYRVAERFAFLAYMIHDAPDVQALVSCIHLEVYPPEWINNGDFSGCYTDRVVH